MSDREQLLHLADRARHGVALNAEHDQLHAGITALGDDRDFWKRLAQDARDAEYRRTAERDEQQTRATQAEAAIERMRKLRAIAPTGAQGPTWAALDLAIDDALPEQQPTA